MPGPMPRPMPRPKSGLTAGPGKIARCVVLCVLAAGSGVIAAGPVGALAQTTVQNKADSAPRKGPGKAGGFVSTNWNVGCQPDRVSKKMVCRLSKAILLAKSRQLLMRVSIGAAPHRLVMQLPHGLSIKAGVRLQIDDHPVQTVAFTTSNQKGIFAGIALTGKLLPAMQKGAMLKITVSAIGGRKITMPLSLTGFSIAFEKMK